MRYENGRQCISVRLGMTAGRPGSLACRIEVPARPNRVKALFTLTLPETAVFDMVPAVLLDLYPAQASIASMSHG